MQVGCMGFCMGGALSFLAGQETDVDAIAPFYGTPDPKLAKVNPPCMLADLGSTLDSTHTICILTSFCAWHVCDFRQHMYHQYTDLTLHMACMYAILRQHSDGRLAPSCWP